MINISINITVHNEGLLLHKTLNSVYANCVYALKENKKLELEINLSLDNADYETKRVIQQFKKNNSLIAVNAYEVSFGDLALSRNFLIDKTNGIYCTFVDGDDLFSENYLFEAYTLASKSDVASVYSPEYLVSFEEHNYIVKKLDFNSTDFKAINCFENNYFISQSFAKTSIFQEIAYRPNSNCFGMEDWDWNNTAMSKGICFYNVPNTIFFYRRKQNSMMINQLQRNAVLRPNKLYEPKKFATLESYDIRISEDPKKVKSKRSNIKQALKYATLGSETIKIYLRDQYDTHKKLINRKPKLTDNNINNPLDSIQVNDLTISFWKKMNKIEPLIRPSKSFLNSVVIGEYPKTSKISIIYHDICKKYGVLEGYEDLVLVPHLVKGGADLAAVRLVNALAKNKPKNRILVIATMSVPSHWSYKVDILKNVDFVNPHDYFGPLSNNEVNLLSLRIIQNWDIKRLHIINSEVGYYLATNHKKALSESFKIYLHTYAFDMDNEGFIYNYITNGLVMAYPYIDKFITDSKGYKTQLITINGFDEEKVSVLDLPVDLEKYKLRNNHKVSKKILWASRISSAKIVETAIEVGKDLNKNGIELHFYGHLDYEYSQDDSFIKLISTLDNAYYHGSFNDFSEIPVKDYDALLFTSKNEGLPNVLLETIATNTFIIASDVGAINEVVEEGINGLLVRDIYNPKAYSEAIEKFYKNSNNESGFSKMTKKNKELIENRSILAYERNLFSILN